MGKVCAWAVALAVLSVNGVASAQDEHAEAVAHFEEGTRLVKQGDCRGAIAEFEKSLALEPGVGARLDLADCEEQIGSADAAWRDFRLAEKIAIERNDARAELARTRSHALERSLELVVVPRIAGLSLVLDGAPVDPLLFADGWLAVSPDGHRLDASAPGREPIVLALPPDAPGRSITLPPLATLPAPAPSPPRPTSPLGGDGSTQRTLGLGLGGVGLVGIAAGTIAGLRAIHDQKDAANACGGAYPRCGTANENTVRDANDGAESFSTIATTCFVAGGVALASGALLYFTAPRAGVRVAPTVGTGTFGASVGGHW
ncbi:MAG TPA: hypothetical protein VF765_33470 [Polyangiaceae bacterium]